MLLKGEQNTKKSHTPKTWLETLKFLFHIVNSQDKFQLHRGEWAFFACYSFDRVNSNIWLHLITTLQLQLPQILCRLKVPPWSLEQCFFKTGSIFFLLLLLYNHMGDTVHSANIFMIFHRSTGDVNAPRNADTCQQRQGRRKAESSQNWMTGRCCKSLENDWQCVLNPDSQKVDENKQKKRTECDRFPVLFLKYNPLKTGQRRHVQCSTSSPLMTFVYVFPFF